MRPIALFALLLLSSFVLLVACAPQYPPPTPDIPAVPTEDPWNPTRPDIPRSDPQPEPDEEEPTTPVTPPPTRPVFLNGTAASPRTELDVPLGDTIGEHHPRITATEFPLLRHRSIIVDSGTTAGYEEELRFDFKENTTGRVIFGKDDDDRIGTFLHFQEDKPILEYRLRLRAGTFSDVRGREIQVLGHTYLIAEATNRTVQLFGVDVANNLGFTNGSRLVVNSTAQTDTIARVTPTEISYILYADDTGEDGILLSPGERLSGKVPRTRLASRILDIAYEGAPLSESATLEIDRTSYGYRLIADTLGGEITLPLVEEDAGALVFGRLDERLHITPCTYNAYCIAPGDTVLLTSPRGQSYLITYGSAKNSSKDLTIRDGQNRYVYDFYGEPGRDAFADIVIDDYPFRARIGPRINGTDDHNISIEQGFVQGRVELALRTGAVVRIGDLNGTRLPIELRIPRRAGTDGREERISINITLSDGDGRVVIGGNLTLVEDEDEDLVGVSQYGVGILLDRDGDDLPPATGREAKLLVPASTAYGIVALEG